MHLPSRLATGDQGEEADKAGCPSNGHRRSPEAENGLLDSTVAIGLADSIKTALSIASTGARPAGVLECTVCSGYATTGNPDGACPDARSARLGGLPKRTASANPSRHDGACPRRALLLASTRPRFLPATTGLVPVERCSSPARARHSLPPRRGLSPSSAAPRQPAPANPSRHDGACPRRALLLASTRPPFPPATTGLVPVERCSSPARARQSLPPRRGLSPSSAAPRQHAPAIPSRHDGACPRRAMLLASTRPAIPSRHDGACPRRALLLASTRPPIPPATTGLVPVERCSSPARARQSLPPRRGLSPSSAAPRQHASANPSRHDGACPRRAMLLASTRPPIPPATTGLVPVERCSSPARARQSFPPRRGLSPSSDAPRQHAPAIPSRHDGACPRRAMLLASTRPPNPSRHDGACPRRALLLASTRPRIPSRHDGACPRRAMLLASTRPPFLPATTGLVPVERCSSPARARQSFPPRRGLSPSSVAPRQHAPAESLPPRRGLSPSSAAPRQHASAEFLPATTGLVPVERCSSPARVRRIPPATTGLVPVERCSSPARARHSLPPRRGLSPSSDAPRQHAPAIPSRHDGACPRRALLLASPRPEAKQRLRPRSASQVPASVRRATSPAIHPGSRPAV